MLRLELNWKKKVVFLSSEKDQNILYVYFSS